jgi:predicted permease
MLKEAVYALKTLRRNPGFALTAILSIALAIGANSTIFSYADGLLLKPLRVPNPSGLVTLRSLPPTVSSLPLRGTGEMSFPDFRDFRRENHSFSGLVAFDEVIAAFRRDSKEPARQFVLGYEVSGDFFRVLGVRPRLGRDITLDDETVEGKEPVVVISAELWRNELSSDPNAVGRRVRLNDVDCTVIGVVPESFTGMDQFLRPQFFVPSGMVAKLYPPSGASGVPARDSRSLVVKGRLKNGVSLKTAGQEASAIAKALEESYPATNRGFGATVNTELEMRLINAPLLGGLVGALFTVAAVVLLIACANIGNLLLVRGRTRGREIAVRLALGASRRRLIRLLLMESLMIAFAGGTLAILISEFTSSFLSTMELPADVPVHLDFQVDTRVLWFTILVSAGSTLLFGLIPAIRSTQPDLMSVIKSGESDTKRSRLFGRHALVVVQIVGSMILLVATTEGRRNFDEIIRGNPGFRRDHRITMRFNPKASGYSDDQAQRFYETLVRRAADVPGIRSAALTVAAPMTFDFETQTVVPEGYSFPSDQQSVEILSNVVDHHYFETLGVPIIAGRTFRDTDRADSPRVAIVNEAFARNYLGANPIGKRLRLNDKNGTLLEVVGLTVTSKTFSLIEPPVQAIYLPLSQNPRSRMTLVADTSGDPAAVVNPLQEVVRSIDSNLVVFRIRTMEDLFDRSTVNTLRIVGRMYDSAAVLGLVLALVGLYAIVSYQVARRTREIGIRMALGAERTDVVKIFLRQAAIMSVIGISIGLVLSVFANQIGAQSLGAAALHPALMAAVGVSMLLTTIAAALLPAGRAARIDPQHALREE